MKSSKEVKIGLMVATAIVILFAGFYYLKGANIFSSKHKYYCHFDNVQGLQVSASVQVRGMEVGRVSDIKLEGNKGVKVTVNINKNINVTTGTTALLASSDLITGTKIIKLTLADNSNALEAGSEIPATIEKSLFDNIGDDVSPVIESAKAVMLELDSIVSDVSSVISDKNKQAINNSLSSIESATKDIAVLSNKLKNESDHIENIITNTDKITTNLSATSDEIAKAPIKKTVDEMQQTAAELQTIIKNVNDGHGSLGKLVKDEQLYNNLNASLSSLDKLMVDLKAHPSRYINLTIFGKRSKKE